MTESSKQTLPPMALKLPLYFEHNNAGIPVNGGDPERPTPRYFQPQRR